MRFAWRADEPLRALFKKKGQDARYGMIPANWAADLARLETKLDAAIAQSSVDRAATTAHIAECNVRNRAADARENQIEARERDAAIEMRAFMAESRADRQKISDKVSQTQGRIAGMIGAVAALGWLVEHFRLFDHVIGKF